MGARFASIFTVIGVLFQLFAYGRHASASHPPRTSVSIIPGLTSPFHSSGEFMTGLSEFEAPKVHPINSTSYDWWYFDAIALDGSASVSFNLFTARASALWASAPDTGSVTWLLGLFALPDGTSWVSELRADSLTVMTSEEGGSSGKFTGIDAGWVGSPDMGRHVVNVNEPGQGINGSLILHSVAPAHAPCSAQINVGGQSLAPSPGFGWNNAVPDADATVDFTVNGNKLQFSGSGYQDKNWGTRPVNASVRSWYWGRARVGPYSIVWFDLIAPDGREHVSSYVARDGRVETASCSNLRVRPVGKNVKFPTTPQTISTAIDGFNVEITIPGEGDVLLEVRNQRLVLEIDDTALRWLGSVSGGSTSKRGKRWKGVAIYEVFAFDI